MPNTNFVHAPRTRSRVATPEQAAEFLQVSRSTIYEMMRLGDLASVKVRRCRRIPWAVLERIVDGGTIDASATEEASGA